jgi:hypothetical protein
MTCITWARGRRISVDAMGDRSRVQEKKQIPKGNDGKKSKGEGIAL